MNRAFPVVVAGVLGSLWGASEVVLGAALHALSVPFKGAILAAAGVVITLAGHRAVGGRFTVLLAGATAALMKLLLPGGKVLTPVISILMEATLLQAALRISGTPRRFGYAAAGAAAVSWCMVQPLIGCVLYGGGLQTGAALYVADKRLAAEMVGLGPDAVLWIVVALGVLHALIGAGAGWLGAAVGRRVGPLLRLPARAADLTVAAPAAAPEAAPPLRSGLGSAGVLVLIADVVLVTVTTRGWTLLIVCGAVLVAAGVYARGLPPVFRRPWLYASIAILLAVAAFGVGERTAPLAFGVAYSPVGLTAGLHLAGRTLTVLVAMQTLVTRLTPTDLVAWLDRGPFAGIGLAVGVGINVFGQLRSLLGRVRLAARLRRARGVPRRVLAVRVPVALLAESLAFALESADAAEQRGLHGAAGRLAGARLSLTDRRVVLASLAALPIVLIVALT